MSASLLYRVFGIRGYRYVRAEYLEGMVVFSIEQKRDTLRCPVCGSAHVSAHGGEDRWFRLVPMGRKPMRLFFRIPCVECGECHVTCQVHVPFAEPRRQYTRAFGRYALELSRRMTILDVARHLDVSWDTIKDMQKRNLRGQLA